MGRRRTAAPSRDLFDSQPPQDRYSRVSEHQPQQPLRRLRTHGPRRAGARAGDAALTGDAALRAGEARAAGAFAYLASSFAKSVSSWPRYLARIASTSLTFSGAFFS